MKIKLEEVLKNLEENYSKISMISYDYQDDEFKMMFRRLREKADE